MTFEKNRLNDFASLLAGSGMDPEFVQNEIYLSKIRKHWENIIGSLIVNQTEVEGIKNGHLMVKVSHSVYQQELLFSEKKIIARLNEILGKNIITKIKFINGIIKKYNVKKKETREKKSISKEENEKFDALLKQEKDEKTRQKLKELLQYL